MSIPSIKRSVYVKLVPQLAFEVFTARMGDWWPRGKTIGKKTAIAITLDPVPGGRWVERDEDGVETQWGKVLIWEPPSRLLLAWQLNSAFTYDPDLVTEVELTFVAQDGGTLVTLEHRNLERLGTVAERVTSQLADGWSSRIADYVTFAENRA